MKNRSFMFLFLAIISFIFAGLFIFFSIDLPKIGNVAVPVSIVLSLMGATNLSIFIFVRELLKKLDLDKK